jgi:hypothetical protein
VLENVEEPDYGGGSAFVLNAPG